MSEMTTARKWTSGEIIGLFDAQREAHPGAGPIWYGPIRTAWVDAKWSVLIDVVNASRNEDGLPDLGPYDFDIHDAEIEGAAAMLARVSFGGQVGTGRPIAVALCREVRPTVFFEEAAEREVRDAVAGFYPEARS